MKKVLLCLLLPATILFSCKKEAPIEEEEKKPTGKVAFQFLHYVDGAPLVIDTLIYLNEAGNEYLINEVQYFISDVTLHKADGSFYRINEWKNIHYIDNDIPETMVWNVFDAIPAGTYSAISFTFGLNEEINQSYMFVNPPESFMFWPTVLGGGYHYLKLNGKWKDPQQSIRFFNFHLGIGQDITATDTTYIHNHFDVTLPNSGFALSENENKTIQIIMNIENWFKNPNTYDHNVWGGDIMENQSAMGVASENGHDVFNINLGCCNK